MDKYGVSPSLFSVEEMWGLLIDGKLIEVLLKKKKPRRRSTQKIFQQITNLDEYKVLNTNQLEREKETK